jgi:hypothetical protein
MGSRSVLEALEDICNVDVDAIDPKVSTSLPFKAHNRMLYYRSHLPTYIVGSHSRRDLEPGY